MIREWSQNIARTLVPKSNHDRSRLSRLYVIRKNLFAGVDILRIFILGFAVIYVLALSFYWFSNRPLPTAL